MTTQPSDSSEAKDSTKGTIWRIAHPGTGHPIYCETFDEAMSKWFEGFNVPVKVTDGIPEPMSGAMARVRAIYRKEGDEPCATKSKAPNKLTEGVTNTTETSATSASNAATRSKPLDAASYDHHGEILSDSENAHRSPRLKAPTTATPGQQTAEGIYVASKTKYASVWRGLRKQGAPIISTWIDEAEEGQSKSYSELSARCVSEISRAVGMILYCRKDDVLKGALIEVGMALALGKPVYCVGESDSLSRVFREHPLWKSCSSYPEAIAALRTEPAATDAGRGASASEPTPSQPEAQGTPRSDREVFKVVLAGGTTSQAVVSPSFARQLETELAAERAKVSAYATAARVIALHLEEFRDDSLTYDEMIAEAARRVRKSLDAERAARQKAEMAVANPKPL